MEYAIELYEKVDGKIPVLDFILSLNPKQQAKYIGKLICWKNLVMNYIILMWILLRVKNIPICGN